MDNEIFQKIDIIDDIPKCDVIENFKNIFPYVLDPSFDVEDYNYFMDELTNKVKKRNSKNNSYKSPNDVINQNIKTIYTIITYPLSKPAYFKFISKEPVTFGMLLFAYTYAYQKIYELEEQDDGNPGLISGMLNRATSKGRFGIWGHDLNDLVYNGGSTISVCEDFVICEFGCDS